MKSDEKSFGEDHPNTTTRYSNLALVLQDLGDYQEARVLLEKAIRSDEKIFGANHPNTAIDYFNLARVFENLGDNANALNFSGKALAIFKKNLPEGHPYIIGVSKVYQSIKDSIENNNEGK